MNKWTMLSLVVLVAILSVSLWLITKAQDPLLEAESAAEQEIGVEEFEGATPDTPDGMTDEEIIMEPEMAMDDAADSSAPETLPSDIAEPEIAQPEMAVPEQPEPDALEPQTKEPEPSAEPTGN
jgi:hypothetical protein